MCIHHMHDYIGHVLRREPVPLLSLLLLLILLGVRQASPHVLPGHGLGVAGLREAASRGLDAARS